MYQLPSYSLLPKKDLEKRASEAIFRLASCHLCPRFCGVDRLSDQRGFCQIGRLAGVASYTPHFGEEDCLVGRAGSRLLPELRHQPAERRAGCLV
ncbi:MAG: hypothetical protein LUQ15_02900 [Methanothrix sp.]|nr:hypothetical protein [Methanothrix sp.]